MSRNKWHNAEKAVNDCDEAITLEALFNLHQKHIVHEDRKEQEARKAKFGLARMRYRKGDKITQPMLMRCLRWFGLIDEEEVESMQVLKVDPVRLREIQSK